MSFIDKLNQAWQQNNSLLCVGLDPDLEKLPLSALNKAEPLFEFNRQIIDQTARHSCCYKPQIAYYSAYGAEAQLEKTIAYIKDKYPSHLVILDAKRGDIGATAEMYAREAFVRYGADAVTVNPYMGSDTLAPFLAYSDKGVIILCRTSNAGSGEIQALQSNGESVAITVAKAALALNDGANVLLVVGATYPDELGQIRRIVGNMPLLVPGIGVQGGALKAVLEQGLNRHHAGLLINSSRGIIYASTEIDFAEAAGKAAKLLNEEINATLALLKSTSA